MFFPGLSASKPSPSWSHPMRPAHQRVVDAYRRVEAVHAVHVAGSPMGDMGCIWDVRDNDNIFIYIIYI